MHRSVAYALRCALVTLAACAGTDDRATHDALPLQNQVTFGSVNGIDALEPKLMACGRLWKASGHFTYVFYVDPNGKLATDPNVRNFDELDIGGDGDAEDGAYLGNCYHDALVHTPFPLGTARQKISIPLWYGCDAPRHSALPCGPR